VLLTDGFFLLLTDGGLWGVLLTDGFFLLLTDGELRIDKALPIQGCELDQWVPMCCRFQGSPSI